MQTVGVDWCFSALGKKLLNKRFITKYNVISICLFRTPLWALHPKSPTQIFNCCWTFAFSSRWIYLTSHQAKWQPICILITVLCLQSTDNELLHIVCSDIFAARNLFSLGVFPKPMEIVYEQLVQFKQELHKQSACWLSMILVWKTLFLYLLIDDCWMATTLINSFMIDEGRSQLLRCYDLTNCWRMMLQEREIQ
jgi:hypothetical protein